MIELVQQRHVKIAQLGSISPDCGEIQGCCKNGEYANTASEVIAHLIERILLMGSFCRDYGAIEFLVHSRQNVARMLMQML